MKIATRKWGVFIVLLAFARVGAAAQLAGPCEWSDSAPTLYELNVGVLAHDVGKLWSNFRRERGIDYNAELTFAKPRCQFLYGDLRPNIGISINDNGDTSKVYAGLILEWSHDSGLFLKAGLGGAIHNGELTTRERNKKELGSRVLFRIPVEVGYAISDKHRISVMFDHVSNGFLADPNEGLDTIGLRYGHRF